MLLDKRKHHEIDKLMESFFRGWSLDENQYVYPGLNAWKKDDTIIVKAELPGIETDDIDISVTGNHLVISGNKKSEKLKDIEYHRQERRYGEFSRTLFLPFNADPSNVEATFRNGILSVTVPRAEEDKPRKIAIKTN